MYMNVQLPLAASLQRTAAVNDKIDAILKETPGRQVLHRRDRLQPAELASRPTTPSTSSRSRTGTSATSTGLTADVIMRELNRRLAGLPDAQAFAFSPPAIPGVGTSGGITFMLEDRAGKDSRSSPRTRRSSSTAARKRPEFAPLFTTFLPGVPQLFADVDRDKVLKQGVNLASVYQTLQAFMGGAFVNYFNRVRAGLAGVRPGRGRVPHAGQTRRAVLRAQRRATSRCRCRRSSTMKTGLRPRVHRALQRVPRGADQRHRSRPGTAPGRACRRSRRSSPQTMPREMGFDYSGMSFQEKVAAQGIPPAPSSASRCSSCS